MCILAVQLMLVGRTGCCASRRGTGRGTTWVQCSAQCGQRVAAKHTQERGRGPVVGQAASCSAPARARAAAQACCGPWRPRSCSSCSRTRPPRPARPCGRSRGGSCSCSSASCAARATCASSSCARARTRVRAPRARRPPPRPTARGRMAASARGADGPRAGRARVARGGPRPRARNPPGPGGEQRARVANALTLP